MFLGEKSSRRKEDKWRLPSKKNVFANFCNFRHPTQMFFIDFVMQFSVDFCILLRFSLFLSVHYQNL